MVVNEDHYINRILHEPGVHDLTVDEFDTDYVLVAARILVTHDPDDVAAVNLLQDGMRLEAGAARPFSSAEYDTTSFDGTRDALLALSRGIGRYDRTFGRKQDVDPVRHLVGTASGWGGLPEQEAFYLNVEPGTTRGRLRADRRARSPSMPSGRSPVYNARRLLRAQPGSGVVSLNSVTATSR